MNTDNKSFMKWNMSLAETLAFGMTVAVFVVWALSFFQTKDDAKEWKSNVEVRMGKIESEVSSMRGSMEIIGRDVSYIRGRIEPKTKNE